MRTLIFLSILFSAIVLPAFGELTDADLNKIRLIVNESEMRIKEELRKDIKAEIAVVKQELKEDIAKSEKNIKEYTALQIHNLDKRLTTYGWVLYIFMPLIVAAIGIPTAIMAWRFAKDNTLEKQVELLTQEVEMLKQQKI